MATYYDVEQHVIDWIEDDSDPAGLRRTINYVLRQLTGQRVFDALREQEVITTDSDGIFTEPALCRKILGVYDNADSPTTTRFAGATGRLHYEGATNLFNRLVPMGVNMARQTTGIGFETTPDTCDTLTQASTSSVDIPAGCVGQRLRVSGISEDYEVLTVTEATQVTIRPSYTPRSPMSGTMSIGKYGLRKYMVEDSGGDAFTGDVLVKYIRHHPKLLNDNDLLLVDIPITLALKTVQRILQFNKYDVDAMRLKSELEETIAAEMGQEVGNRTNTEHRPSMFNTGRVRWKR